MCISFVEAIYDILQNCEFLYDDFQFFDVFLWDEGQQIYSIPLSTWQYTWGQMSFSTFLLNALCVLLIAQLFWLVGRLGSGKLVSEHQVDTTKQ